MTTDPTRRTARTAVAAASDGAVHSNQRSDDARESGTDRLGTRALITNAAFSPGGAGPSVLSATPRF